MFAVMNSGEHLDAALANALRSFPDVEQKWIAVTHKIISQYGVANGRIAGHTRLDIMLRQLEAEFIAAVNAGNWHDDHFRFDLQVALSEQWVLSSYEIIRSCRDIAERKGMDFSKLKAVRDQISLVRTPLAKYEIDKTNRRKPDIMLAPVVFVSGADNSEIPYDTDGRYVVPMTPCFRTGAIVWHPIDIKKNDTVPVCRRDISDAILTLFD